MRYTRPLWTLKQTGFFWICEQNQKVHVLHKNVPRKFQNCSEFNKNADSLPAKSAHISRKNTEIPTGVRKSGFLSCWRFMYVTNRIKSQLVGMNTVISANYACFKLTVLKFSVVYSCMLQVLNLWGLQSPTQTLPIWARTDIITSNSNGWIVRDALQQNVLTARATSTVAAVKSSLFVGTVYI